MLRANHTGYEKYKLKGQKGKSLKPVPEQAIVVKYIFEECLNATPISTIANTLNSKNIPAPKGGKWIRCTVRQILRNPVYIGKIKWEDKRTKKKIVDGKVIRVRNPESELILVDGLHEPIIEENLFNDVQKILDARITPKTKQRAELINALSGILKCEICGRTMVLKLKYPREKRNPSLACHNCHNSSSIYGIVEKKLLGSLSTLLQEYKLDYKDIDTSSQTETLLLIDKQNLNDKCELLEKLHIQQNNLYDLLEQGVYEKTIFFERSALIKEKISTTQKEIEDLHIDIEKLENVLNNKRIFVPKLQYIIDTYWETDDIVLKNKLLKSVLTKVTYKKVNPKSPEDFTLTLYPKLF